MIYFKEKMTTMIEIIDANRMITPEFLSNIRKIALRLKIV